MFVVMIDHANADKYKNSFQTREEAVDYTMNVYFAVSTTEEEKKKTRCWVEEHEGKLYNQTRGPKHYTKYDELFEEYTPEKPKTIAELREYISQGNHVTMFWSDRGPCEYYISDTDSELEKERKAAEDIEALEKEIDKKDITESEKQFMKDFCSIIPELRISNN